MDPVNRMLKSAPFLKLLPALIAGILLQWYVQLPFMLLAIALCVCLATLIIFRLLPVHIRFKFRSAIGLTLLFLTVCAGTLTTWYSDARNHATWFWNISAQGEDVLVTVQEPLVSKPSSYKAVCSVEAVKKVNQWMQATGKLIVYFKKDSLSSPIAYGSRVVLHKKVQPIMNSGNPGAFDYKRYCLLQDIAGQVFVTEKDYRILPGNAGSRLSRFLFAMRDNSIRIIKQFIPGNNEQGVAEALLIGYRYDLDKDLVQAYSNTGVVHVIAISGLHLGMIYGLLVWVLSLLPSKNSTRWIKAILILAILWLFTLIAGGAPSILRSAVMFSFIVIGQGISRRTNMYNSLAGSAFCLLVFNPFMLWDVGFLLSYSAVTSIVLFMKPVYNLFNFENKILDKIWQLSAVSLAAQILTLPLVIYYFHQLPLLFLVTNLVVVPLSGFILYGELLLLILSFFPFLVSAAGKLLGFLILMMNNFIIYINQMPFAVWSGLQLTVLQSSLLFTIIIALTIWMLKKSKLILFGALAAILFFFVLRCIDFWQHCQQRNLIVYNIPRHTAIDIVQGRKSTFFSDSLLFKNLLAADFHLKPSRVQQRISPVKNYIVCRNTRFSCAGKSILLINDDKHSYSYGNIAEPDILIISGNPRQDIFTLISKIRPKMVVFDASNPVWKIEKWKKGCDSLHLRFHSVPEQGAFVMDL
ncbi:ComEC/Rec2 family competence protein [Danxiaibacter flavus]|uniref:ComEC/Rec2 family competence protein n=1 Tax=Danxiaibacter flavus TaxID=3049108 RepID=A0ABV3ZN10_9BACT|nr:ComEC/Rec2 family competence protein [Chitinophagaceae bacterium DXS]